MLVSTRHDSIRELALHSAQSVIDDDDDDDDDDDEGGTDGNCGSLATTSPTMECDEQDAAGHGATDLPHPRQKSTR